MSSAITPSIELKALRERSQRLQRLELSRIEAEQNPLAWWERARPASAVAGSPIDEPPFSRLGENQSPVDDSARSGGLRPQGRTPRPGRPSARPLSSVQIRSFREKTDGKTKENCKIKVARNGTYLGLHVPGEAPQGRADRVAVTSFSPKSRKLLLDHLNQIDRERVRADQIAFGTLTYPEEFPSARVSKKHFRLMDLRFRRRFPSSALVWKIEPQKRGAPHFHFLQVEPGEISEERVCELATWWASNWCEVVNSGDPRHLSWHLGLLGHGNKPCVEKVRSWNGVMSYASKYLCKLTPQQHEHFDRPGRYWGIINRECLPKSVEETDVTPQQATLLKRQVRRWIERQTVDRFYIPGAPRISGSHSPGQWFYGDQPFMIDSSSKPRPFRECVPHLEKLLGRKIRQRRRRVFRSSGGISAYLSDVEGRRLLSWALREAPGQVEPPAPF